MYCLFTYILFLFLQGKTTNLKPLIGLLSAIFSGDAKLNPEMLLTLSSKSPWSKSRLCSLWRALTKMRTGSSFLLHYIFIIIILLLKSTDCFHVLFLNLQGRQWPSKNWRTARGQKWQLQWLEKSWELYRPMGKTSVKWYFTFITRPLSQVHALTKGLLNVAQKLECTIF